MNAHLDFTFQRGFFLTEESLIKLTDIIRNRLQSVDPNASLIFKVFRADGMLVEFDTPADVVAQENSTRNAIRRVALISTGASYKLELTFDHLEQTELEVDADDRDMAYLLQSDIKEYLHSEVLKFRKFSFDSIFGSRVTFLLLMSAVIGYGIFVFKSSNSEVVEAIVKSTDVNEKLNFIIQARAAEDNRGEKYFIPGLAIFFVVMIFLGDWIDKIFPKNIFYWGKAMLAYNRLLSVRDKVIWGIVVAFVVGIASTIAIDYVKSQTTLSPHTGLAVFSSTMA